MKVINLYGGPGSGKSTTAAGLFSLMKIEGQRVELVTEFARDEINSGNAHRLQNQDWIFAHQHHRIERLKDNGLDYVITDSPLLLMLVYAENVWIDKPYLNSFKQFVYDVDQTYTSYNFFMQRADQSESELEDDLGRIHTLEQSKKIDNQILTMLKYHNIIYKQFVVGLDTIEKIYSDINRTYNEYNKYTTRQKPSGLSINKYSLRGH
jgi:ABC-type oligopeptide transport system ATPase subunit